MAIFGVITDNKKSVRDYIKVTADRMASDNFVKNPFSAYCKIISYNGDDKKSLSVFKMFPLWPNFPPYVALFLTVGVVLFNGITPTFWFILPFFFLGLGFFWSETFFYWSFKAGLKKAGYQGPINKIKKDDLIDELARRF